MDGCIYRTKYGECTIPNRSMEYGPLCRSDCTDKHPSNADRIRAMSDEELAEFITDDFCELLNCYSPCDGQCDKRMREWLKLEALRGYDIDGGGIRYDEEGNVIDYGIVGPPGEPGVKEATDGT